MKKWIKAVAFSLALILAVPVTVQQCDQTVVQAATKKPKLNVKNNKKTLYVGDKFKIKVTNYKDKFKWTSSNKKVATVDKNGVIKAKKAGIATISTTKDQYWIYCTVVVKNKSTNKKPADNKPIDNTPKFDAEEAKSKITFTSVETCKGLYEVTSTYDIPTMVTANYKIIDNNGVTVTKSSKSVVAVSWDKTYLRIPVCENEQTMQLTYEYKECKNNLTKDISDKAYNSIKICKYECGDYDSYTVYIKNISNRKYESAITFNLCAYDSNGDIIGFEEDLYIREMDIDEIISYPYLFFAGAKDICEIKIQVQY